MDDPTGITGDVFEQLGVVGKASGQTAVDEAKRIPSAIAGQLFGSPKPLESEDQKELAEKQELEQKKAKEKVQSEAEVQQILAQLEEEMEKYRKQRVEEEGQYRNQQIAKAVPEGQVEEEKAKNLPTPLEVQKTRAEMSAGIRGE